jgi:hypothetical protein
MEVEVQYQIEEGELMELQYPSQKEVVFGQETIDRISTSGSEKKKLGSVLVTFFHETANSLSLKMDYSFKLKHSINPSPSTGESHRIPRLFLRAVNTQLTCSHRPRRGRIWWGLGIFLLIKPWRTIPT